MGCVVAVSARPYRAVHAMIAATAALELAGKTDLADDLWRACGHVSSLVGCVHGLCLLPGAKLTEGTLMILRETLEKTELNS